MSPQSKLWLWKEWHHCGTLLFLFHFHWITHIEFTIRTSEHTTLQAQFWIANNQPGCQPTRQPVNQSGCQPTIQLISQPTNKRTSQSAKPARYWGIHRAIIYNNSLLTWPYSQEHDHLNRDDYMCENKLSPWRSSENLHRHTTGGRLKVKTPVR